MKQINAQKGTESVVKETVKLFFMTYVVVLSLMLIGYALVFQGALSKNHEHWGQFGDFIGGILNPLTSFFTLIVAFSLWALQERELAKTTQALNQQTATNELQRFENTLFKLVEHCQKPLSLFSVKKSSVSAFNAQVISNEAVRHMLDQLDVAQDFIGDLNPESIKSSIKENDAFDFHLSYTAIRYAYLFALQKCPDPSKSTEYATMVYMLIGDDAMKLCRYWGIASDDQDFLMALLKAID